MMGVEGSATCFGGVCVGVCRNPVAWNLVKGIRARVVEFLNKSPLKWQHDILTRTSHVVVLSGTTAEKQEAAPPLREVRERGTTHCHISLSHRNLSHSIVRCHLIVDQPGTWIQQLFSGAANSRLCISASCTPTRGRSSC